MEIVTTQGNFCNHVCFLRHLQKIVRYTGTVNANIFKGVKFCHLCITQHRHAHTSFMCVWRLDLDEIKYRYMQAYSTCTCIWKHLQLFDLPVPWNRGRTARACLVWSHVNNTQSTKFRWSLFFLTLEWDVLDRWTNQRARCQAEVQCTWSCDLVLRTDKVYVHTY